MEYDVFLKEIETQVKNILGDGYNVNIRKVIKPNNLILDALNIAAEGIRMAPNIYMRPVYEFYLENVDRLDLNGMARMIIDMSSGMMEFYPDAEYELDFFDKIEDFENVINRVEIRMVNRELSSTLLESVVYIPFLDLAATFCIRTVDINGARGIVRVTRELLDKWEISEEELFEIAMENTRRETIFNMKSLNLMMEEMYKKIKTEDKEEQFTLDTDNEKNDIMYAIYEESMSNGSVALLMNDMLGSYARKLGGDLLILPSSVNELICMKDGAFEDYDAIRSIVSNANQTVVYHDEILSYNIYRYSCRDDSVSIIA